MSEVLPPEEIRIVNQLNQIPNNNKVVEVPFETYSTVAEEIKYSPTVTLDDFEDMCDRNSTDPLDSMQKAAIFERLQETGVIALFDESEEGGDDGTFRVLKQYPPSTMQGGVTSTHAPSGRRYTQRELNKAARKTSKELYKTRGGTPSSEKIPERTWTGVKFLKRREANQRRLDDATVEADERRRSGASGWRKLSDIALTAVGTTIDQQATKETLRPQYELPLDKFNRENEPKGLRPGQALPHDHPHFWRSQPENQPISDKARRWAGQQVTKIAFSGAADTPAAAHEVFNPYAPKPEHMAYFEDAILADDVRTVHDAFEAAVAAGAFKDAKAAIAARNHTLRDHVHAKLTSDYPKGIPLGMEEILVGQLSRLYYSERGKEIIDDYERTKKKVSGTL